MNKFSTTSLVIATFATLIGAAAQAQTIDNAHMEVHGNVPLPVVTPSATTAGTGLSRAEVMAEFRRAQAAGELDFAYAEVNGALPQRGSVRASDLRQAMSNRK